jgi:aspartate racemase
MKKIGIVGGVAWQSTVEYYSEICRRSALWHQAANPGSAPATLEMSIESLDLNRAVSYLGTGEDEESWAKFDDYHRAALQRVEVSGADFALMASNSPHHRFQSIIRGVGIPVISILDAVARESVRAGATEVLILGTDLAMKSVNFRDEFTKHGINAAGPIDDGMRRMTVDLIADLQLGKTEGAAERLARIAKMAFEQQFKARPVVCLACTELPGAFEERKTRAVFEHDGVTYINSTAAHIQAALDFAMDNQPDLKDSQRGDRIDSDCAARRDVAGR